MSSLTIDVLLVIRLPLSVLPVLVVIVRIGPILCHRDVLLGCRRSPGSEDFASAVPMPKQRISMLERTHESQTGFTHCPCFRGENKLGGRRSMHYMRYGSRAAESASTMQSRSIVLAKRMLLGRVDLHPPSQRHVDRAQLLVARGRDRRFSLLRACLESLPPGGGRSASVPESPDHQTRSSGTLNRA